MSTRACKQNTLAVTEARLVDRGARSGSFYTYLELTLPNGSTITAAVDRGPWEREFTRGHLILKDEV